MFYAGLTGMLFTILTQIIITIRGLEAVPSMKDFLNSMGIAPGFYQAAFYFNMITIVLMTAVLNTWMLFIVASWANRCEDEEKEEFDNLAAAA